MKTKKHKIENDGGIYKEFCTIFASRYKNEEQDGEMKRWIKAILNDDLRELIT